MANDQTNQSNGASVIEKSVGVIERAWDAQWALRLLFVVMFFDGAMLLRTGRGLWQWSEAGAGVLSDVGWLSSVVVAFCLTAAIVMPTVLTLLSQFITFIVCKLPSAFWMSDNRNEQRSMGEVPASALRDEALEKNDAFLLRLYENHERDRLADEEARRRIGNLMATAVLIMFVDWWIGRGAVGGFSLIGVLIEAMGSWAERIIVIVLIPVVWCLKWTWFPPYVPNCIYYPPLDRKLRNTETSLYKAPSPEGTGPN